jgi:hypothetical protein
MKCITRRIILTMFVFMVLFGGCKKKEESILPSANNVQETTNKTENTKVSEDIKIDKEYLEKKYPGKTVLTWVYTEIENMSKKERKKYNEPLGMKYITNNQVIKLNDYLVSKGKEYVICFKKIGTGKNYARNIEKLTQKGEAPDFIFSERYLDEKSKNYTSYLTYELIGKDMFEELSQYKNGDLKKYFSTLPENAIKLSSVNGKFYGYNEAIGELETKHKWYVNVDLAKEYGIDLDKYKIGGYEEWLEACNKVYAGEKKKGSIDFVVCYGGTLKPIYESSVAGYMDKLDEKGNTDVSAFSISLNGKSIENYFKLKDIKKSLKEVREYQNRGYFEYLNENEFKKKEKSLKKYNMIAFKKLIFDCVPALRDGTFPGEVVSRNSTENFVKYEYKLPTDHLFSKVHGDIKLHYTVYEAQKLVMLNDLSPDILSEGHQKELTAYKGVMVSKSHAERDMFKINLLNSMNKNGFLNSKILIGVGIVLTILVGVIIYLMVK